MIAHVRTPRVLVVEDDPSLRTFLGEFFRVEGYEADLCENAALALGKLEECSYSCLITDLVMPGMSGLQLIQLLHERRLRLPALLISSELSGEVQDQCLKLGVECLAKPFHIKSLRSAFQKAVSLRPPAVG